MDQNITIEGKDGFTAKVGYSAAREGSNAFRELMNELPKYPDLTEHFPVALDEATPPVLKKVAEFLDHHFLDPMKPIPKPLESDDVEDCLDGWYRDFIRFLDVEESERDDVLSKLLVIADFLEIPALLDLCSAKYASILRLGLKDKDAFLKRFNIDPETLPKTPAEEEKLREEYSWLFENLEPAQDDGAVADAVVEDN